jgi:hypothetical protein
MKAYHLFFMKSWLKPKNNLVNEMNDLIIIFWIFLSLITAHIAANKGNSALLTFLGSILFSPLFGFLMCLSKGKF